MCCGVSITALFAFPLPPTTFLSFYLLANLCDVWYFTVMKVKQTVWYCWECWWASAKVKCMLRWRCCYRPGCRWRSEQPWAHWPMVDQRYVLNSIEFFFQEQSIDQNELNLQVGTIGGTFISALILHQYDSWHMVFYFFGVFTIIWCLFFVSFRLIRLECHGEFLTKFNVTQKIEYKLHLYIPCWPFHSNALAWPYQQTNNQLFRTSCATTHRNHIHSLRTMKRITCELN